MNKEKIKEYLKVSLMYIGVVGLVGGIGYSIWRNPIYNPAGPQTQEVKSDIEVRFIDAVVRGRRKGTPHWTVYSKVVESERNSSMVYFREKPNGEFYNIQDWNKNIKIEDTNPNNLQNGVPASPIPSPTASPSGSPGSLERLRTFTWNADSAEYNTETEDLILKKNVDIVTDDKDIIKTDELRWNNYDKKAISDTRTNITASKGYPVIDADHVEGDVKLDILNLKGNVEITTQLSDEQQL